MTDALLPLPGPSDEVILKEIRRHMALCGPEFPDCGIGHAMRYIFAQEANTRTPSPKLELPQEVLEMMERVESSDGHYSTRAEKVLAAFIRRIAGEGA